MPNWCTTPWTKQLEQWLRWTKNKHKDIKFHAMLLNNCLRYWVVTILLRQTFFFNLHFIWNFWICRPHCQIYSCMWMEYWDLRCTDAHSSDSPELQNCGRQTGSDHECEEREGERERGPPASCPGFVYNKKPLFDVVAQPAPKLLLPQDVLWVKCQTEATAGWLQPHRTSTLSKGPWRLREMYKTTTVWCIFVLCLGEKCVRIISVYQWSTGVVTFPAKNMR